LVVQFEAIRRAPDEVRRGVYQFLNVDPRFQPKLESSRNEARAPRFPLLQSGAQKVYERVSGLPGLGKVLKSPVVAKTLQDAYHRFNSKARKYEALALEARARWEAYYAQDQAELARQLQNLRVIT
jgi:hypothetical protein